MSVTVVYDCTGQALGSFKIPAGVVMAGYMTGTGIVPWNAAQWAAHPDAIRIDQWPVNTATDETADILDVENGAGTYADCAPWAKAALASFNQVKRPGQRKPAIYASANNITNVANALLAGGVKSGVGLWVANWSVSDATATADVLAGSGPYPIIGFQWQSDAQFDVSVFSSSWLNDRSAHAPVPPPTPTPIPVTSVQKGWNWCKKCMGLFYGPSQNKSHCPQGGQHDGTGSYHYEMTFTTP